MYLVARIISVGPTGRDQFNILIPTYKDLVDLNTEDLRVC